MASLVSAVAPGIDTSFAQATDGHVGVIHCRVTKTPGSFSTVTAECSLQCNWQLMYNGKQLLLHAVTLQLGYSGDSGQTIFKNSALVAGAQVTTPLQPMTWTKANTGNTYRVSFTASASLSLQFHYQVSFELNENLPPELEQNFQFTQQLAIVANQPSTDYSVRISVN